MGLERVSHGTYQFAPIVAAPSLIVSRLYGTAQSSQVKRATASAKTPNSPQAYPVLRDGSLTGLVEHSGAQSQHSIQTSRDPAGEEGYSKRHARRILLLTTAGVTDGGRDEPEACPALLN